MTKLVVLASLLLPSLALADETPVEPTPTPTPEPAGPPLVPAPEPAPPVTPAPVEPKPAVATTPDLPKASVEKQADKPKLPLVLKPGGYVHMDTRRLLTDQEQHDMTIRRLRFKLDGSAGPHFKFRTLIDFAGSKLVVDDAWGEIVISPELQFRAGKDKSQFGLERLVSAAELVFIERAYPTQLSPNRDIGVWARGDLAKGFVHYAAGIVDGVADNAVIEAESDSVVEFNVHLLVFPFATRKELGTLALGGATTFGPTHGTVASPGLTSVKSAAQTTIVKFATGMDAASTALADGKRTRFTTHGYYYRGPVGVLGEYVRDREHVLVMDGRKLVDNQAWQIATSVAVTPGDRPTYKAIRPVKPFDPAKKQYGAVELAARFAELRVDDAAFEMGAVGANNSAQTIREFTLGGNWYFNDYIKLQLDYSLTSFEPFEGGTDRPSEHLIATRLQAAI